MNETILTNEEKKQATTYRDLNISIYSSMIDLEGLVFGNKNDFSISKQVAHSATVRRYYGERNKLEEMEELDAYIALQEDIDDLLQLEDECVNPGDIDARERIYNRTIEELKLAVKSLTIDINEQKIISAIGMTGEYYEPFIERMYKIRELDGVDDKIYSLTKDEISTIASKVQKISKSNVDNMAQVVASAIDNCAQTTNECGESCM